MAMDIYILTSLRVLMRLKIVIEHIVRFVEWQIYIRLLKIMYTQLLNSRIKYVEQNAQN